MMPRLLCRSVIHITSPPTPPRMRHLTRCIYHPILQINSPHLVSNVKAYSQSYSKDHSSIKNTCMSRPLACKNNIQQIPKVICAMLLNLCITITCVKRTTVCWFLRLLRSSIYIYIGFTIHATVQWKLFLLKVL